MYVKIKSLFLKFLSLQDSNEQGPSLDTIMTGGRVAASNPLLHIQQQIDADNTLENHFTVHFTMHSNTFTHAFQSTTFLVREFREVSERLETYLTALAAKINSNEEFSPDDTFNVETTPSPGRGHGKRYKPSTAAIRGITKTSRVTIKNDDDLCCARAIVTMKAYMDTGNDSRDPDYHNLKKGCHVQQRKAQELHRDAGVPEGTCGIAQLKTFQAALPGYQLKVVSIDPPHLMIYVGSTPSHKIIRLIKDGDHYDGCNSFKGLLNYSYFCDDCDCGFNDDDF